MLHTKFRGSRPTGSGEEFLGFFIIYGRGGHLGHVTWTIHTNFGSPFPRRLHIKMALIGQAVSEEKMFENGRWTDGYGRRPTDADSMGIL